MGALRERIRDFLERVGPKDRAVPIAIATIVLLIAVVAVAVRSPGSGDESSDPTGTASRGPDAGEAGGIPGDDGASGPAAAGRTGSRISSGSAGGTGDTSKGSSGPRSGASAQGGGPVEVGIYVAKNAGSYFEATGVNFDIGDTEAQAKAVIDYLNARGGLLGRRIVPVFAALDVGSSDSWAAQEQAACSTWTEDHDVVSVVTSINMYGTAQSCLHEQGVPLVFAHSVPVTTAEFNRYPLMASPLGPNQDRVARPYVDGLVAQRFFARRSAAEPTKVGLVFADSADQHRFVSNSLVPALGRHGLKLEDKYAASPLQATSSLGVRASEMAQAAQRFQARGITHVLFVLENLTYFMQAAESSQYRPRYGITTFNAPDNLQANAPKEQLRETFGVGWRQTRDVDATRDPGTTPMAKRCLDIMRKAGQDLSNRTAHASMFAYCDTLFVLKAAFEASGAITGDAFQSGLASLGSSYVPAGTFANWYGPGRPDGVAEVRRFAFHDDCSCFGYTSGPIPIR